MKGIAWESERSVCFEVRSVHYSAVINEKLLYGCPALARGVGKVAKLYFFP